MTSSLLDTTGYAPCTLLTVNQHRTTHTPSFSVTITLSARWEIEVRLPLKRGPFNKPQIQQYNKDTSDQENEHRPTQATATDILLVDEDDAFREQHFPFPVNKEITVQSIPAVEPTAIPSDHDYCSYGNEKAHPQTCNAECQTNSTL